MYHILYTRYHITCTRYYVICTKYYIIYIYIYYNCMDPLGWEGVGIDWEPYVALIRGPSNQALVQTRPINKAGAQSGLDSDAHTYTMYIYIYMYSIYIYIYRHMCIDIRIYNVMYVYTRTYLPAIQRDMVTFSSRLLRLRSTGSSTCGVLPGNTGLKKPSLNRQTAQSRSHLAVSTKLGMLSWGVLTMRALLFWGLH